MKTISSSISIFTPLTKTIDTSIVNFDVKNLYSIINQTKGKQIFRSGYPGLGYSKVTGSSIILEYDTSKMKADDIIQIIYESDDSITISPRPNTTGSNGTTPYKLISLASTNANVVKASGGNLYSIVAIGLTSTVRFLKFYNKATAPTVGTDIPVMTIPVPANTQGAGISIPFSMGVNFPLGIAIAITAGSADNDTIVIAANDVLINLTYA